jgi:nitroreductase/FMN reductase [NAD(P)H]
MSINELVGARFGQASTIGATVAANDTLGNILSRRSHRAFKPEPVPGDLLDTLLATAFSAPSKSDLQQACVILVKDRAKQHRIARLSAHTEWLAEAPVFMVWCGDSRRIRRLADWRGHEFANDHLDAFMNAAVDAGICMQTFIVAAESVGLGCCPVSEIRDRIEPLSQELQLPEFVFPVAGLCLGWPQQPGPVKLRLPLTVTTHIDAYHDDNLVAEVSAYDRRREAIENTPPQQQRLVQKFGVSPDYGWSENRTRQYSQPARQDFGSYIRRQGFDLS